ncbi:uncharacterized protein BXZ73DRAFT_78001 [Epithele typhae]|uniref:uncharacterized protein n=1 Tax=Epithele typhae TaxID=378194 RepID=UPI00200774D6|nr:uncharacterized protein BXZ73DRAFT_78001 [Epithele typhae]KAH9929889.1 hypothetical protein BXZ73DRAFT_78001 [Epithele typhae]
MQPPISTRLPLPRRQRFVPIHDTFPDEALERPARKKQAVGHAVPQPHAQLSVETGSSSVYEVIDISSDEDTGPPPPRKRGRTAERVPSKSEQDLQENWFSKALAIHCASHPAYDIHSLVPDKYRLALSRHDLPPQARIEVELSVFKILRHVARPNYTCPTCRMLVGSAPTENFVLKKVVQAAAGVDGQAGPDAEQVVGTGPFGGFFFNYNFLLA